MDSPHGVDLLSTHKRLLTLVADDQLDAADALVDDLQRRYGNDGLKSLLTISVLSMNTLAPDHTKPQGWVELDLLGAYLGAAEVSSMGSGFQRMVATIESVARAVHDERFDSVRAIVRGESAGRLKLLIGFVARTSSLLVARVTDKIVLEGDDGAPEWMREFL